jgi:ferredoxin-NADP reductase
LTGHSLTQCVKSDIPFEAGQYLMWPTRIENSMLNVYSLIYQQ